MHKFYSIKFLFIISICTTPIWGSSYCMELENKSNIVPVQIIPLTQPNDPVLTNKRKTCIHDEQVFTLFPNNVLLETAPKGSRPGACYNVAMRECLRLSPTQFQHIEQSIVGLSDWVTIIGMPHTFFDQKQNPQHGYLTTYTHRSNHNIKHFGKVTHNVNRIKSKLGTSKYTAEHDYWDLPDWGDVIRFWKLKKIYRDQNGKNQLFANIMDIIQNSQRMKQLLQDAQKTLFAVAANQQCDTYFSRIDWKEPFHLIKGVMGLKIDALDENGETSLMLASREGNLYLVNLLIEHGADRHLKNKEDKDAYELAKENNHQDIIKYFHPYSAPTIRYYSCITLMLAAYYFYNNL